MSYYISYTGYKWPVYMMTDYYVSFGINVYSTQFNHKH